MFGDIVGHERVLGLFRRALTGKRTAHAYLLLGPEGVGKALAARSAAAWLLCPHHTDQGPCGHCPGCRQFASHNHPDFLPVRPEGAFIRIDRVRALKRELAFAPFAGGVRVVFIEEAQAMRREAANSLLKLLEEPPPDNIFFLIASEAEPLLETIVSRCQQLVFASLPAAKAARVIRNQRPEMDEEQALLLARLAGGSPGRALRLEAGEILTLSERIVRNLDKEAGRPDDLVEQALLLAADMAALDDELPLLLDLLRVRLRDRMVEALDPDCGGKAAVLAREGWNLSLLSDKMRAIDDAAANLAANCNRGLVCEVLMLELLT